MSNTLEVSIFDDNGWFLSTCICQENPKQSGTFIQPVNSTVAPLPVYTPGTQLPQFVLGVWNVEPDYRGQIWYNKSDGTPEVISEPGVPASTLTNEPPVTTNTVNNASPNLTAFLDSITTALGGIVIANNRLNNYTALIPTLQIGSYTNAGLLIENALETATITATEYSEIKTAAIANNIPLNLT